ncbi:Zinc finger, RING-type, conserved site [Phytophthora cactorum]|nr:Zinc finger, RING-type, conserved site [Phytophthora cactorum]
MAQRSDLALSGDTDAQRVESGVTVSNVPLEAQAIASTSVASSGSSSVPLNSRLNMGVPVPSSLSNDALPRPHSHVQRSTSDTEMERRTPYDPALRGFVGRSNSTSFDPENDPEEAELLRQRLLAAALSTPVSGDAPDAILERLRRRETGSDENTAQADETGRLLSTEGRGEGSPPRTRRRLSSESSMYSMSASGELERSDSHVPPSGNTTETAASTRPTGRAGRGRRNSDEEGEDQTAMDELQALFRRCHNSLPFVALFLIYFAYQHATGILVFVVGTVAVMGLDQRMRAQVALKDKANSWHLLGIVAMCAVDMVAICSVDGQPNPLRHFSQISTRQLHTVAAVIVDFFRLEGSSGRCFGRYLSTAFVAGAKSDRFHCEMKYRDEVSTNEDESSSTIAIADEEDESTTAETPLTQRVVSTVAFYRRKRKLYGLIEMCSIFLRSLLASIPWCSFYQLCASKFMADVFTFAYVFIKGLILATQGRRIFILARSFVTLGLEFGVYVSHDELVEAGSPDCSICYETMRQPVKLACSHMFCEECVTEWFDHERSCPLCRASVGSGSSEEENVKPQFLDGRTSLVPQLL